MEGKILWGSHVAVGGLTSIGYYQLRVAKGLGAVCPQGIPKRGFFSCRDSYPLFSKNYSFRIQRGLRDHLSAHFTDGKVEAQREEKGLPAVEENGGPSGLEGSLSGVAC